MPNTLDSQLCRVCGAPQGAYVKRSAINRAQWVVSDKGAPASVFWLAAERVTLNADGVCLDATGCSGVPRPSGIVGGA